MTKRVELEERVKLVRAETAHIAKEICAEIKALKGEISVGPSGRRFYPPVLADHARLLNKLTGLGHDGLAALIKRQAGVDIMPGTLLGWVYSGRNPTRKRAA